MRSPADYIVTKNEVHSYADHWLSTALKLEEQKNELRHFFTPRVTLDSSVIASGLFRSQLYRIVSAVALVARLNHSCRPRQRKIRPRFRARLPAR